MIKVQTESEEQVDQVKKVVRDAFYREGANEDFNEWNLIGKLREDKDVFIPELSLVAIDDSLVVGHILLTKGYVSEHETLVLAPLSVSPAYQNQGIGTKLMYHAIAKAKALGYNSINVLGGDYYKKFGFKSANDYGITLNNKILDEHLYFLELNENCLEDINGLLTYGACFYDESGNLI